MIIKLVSRRTELKCLWFLLDVPKLWPYARLNLAYSNIFFYFEATSHWKKKHVQCKQHIFLQVLFPVFYRLFPSPMVTSYHVSLVSSFRKMTQDIDINVTTINNFLWHLPGRRDLLADVGHIFSNNMRQVKTTDRVLAARSDLWPNLLSNAPNNHLVTFHESNI